MPALDALTTEAEFWGLEVNLQKTMMQALGNIQDVPPSVTVLEQEEFVYLAALIYMYSPTQLSRHHEME